MIRRFFLSKLAKRQLRFLAMINFERVVDHGSRHYFYYNHASGRSYWSKPSLLEAATKKSVKSQVVQANKRKPSKESEEEDMIPWSISFYAGKPIYLNVITGEVLNDKPEGFMVCHKCQTLLAIRKCEATSCQCSLCFGCYRAVHLAMPTVRASRGDHDGVPCKPIDCCKCKAAAAAAAATTPADRHCHECDLDLCKSCFARIHRSPLLAMHAWSKI